MSGRTSASGLRHLLILRLVMLPNMKRPFLLRPYCFAGVLWIFVTGGCSLLRSSPPPLQPFKARFEVERFQEISLAGVPLQEYYHYEALNFEQAVRLIKATYRDEVVVNWAFTLAIRPSADIRTIPAWKWSLRADDTVYQEGRQPAMKAAAGLFRIPFRLRFNLSESMAGAHPRAVYARGFKFSPLHPAPVDLYLEIVPLWKTGPDTIPYRDTITIALMDTLIRRTS